MQRLEAGQTDPIEYSGLADTGLQLRVAIVQPLGVSAANG